MWKSINSLPAFSPKKILSVLLAAFCFLFSSPSVCSASEQTYTITGERLTTLESNLAALENNNKSLSDILNKQERELRQARQTSEQQSRTLKELQERLTAASSEISTAKNSLQTANDELQNVVASLRKSESRMQRVKMQRGFWAFIAAVCVSIAVGVSV